MTMRPVISRRANTFFAELFLAPGPQAIGATGDNSFAALFGRSWALEWREEDGRLHLHQMSATEVGVWSEVVAGLPPVFAAPAPVGSRRWSLAFDQAARVVLAYEDDLGVVRVTRWDTSSNSYVQNVSFSGHDPMVWIDAQVADLSLSPEESVQQALSYGWRTVFEWTPTGQWINNPLVDSDVLIFYLSADRTQLRVRVQRQLYQQEHMLWDFEQPVILDRVVALFGKYQALVSGADGEPLANVLISEAYVGEVMPVIDEDNRLAASVLPENIRADSQLYNHEDGDGMNALVQPENIAVVGNTFPYVDGDEMDALIVPENISVVGSLYPTSSGDEMNASTDPEDIEARFTDSPIADDNEMIGVITVENIRVQRNA